MSVHSEFRAWLKNLPAQAALNKHESVVVGLSGGADSLALTRAAIMLGLDVHAVVVDHQLQQGSAQVAAQAARQARELGAASAQVIQVNVQGDGEEPARRARYEALGRSAAKLGHLPVLVAHTANDDAEGVILGLIRGSGGASLAGMRSVSHHHPVVDAGAAWLGRPLLKVTRHMTEQECNHAGLDFYNDPHNSSAEFTRSRVRTEILPLLHHVSGKDLTSNLARTARMLREDEQALQRVAEHALEDALAPERAPEDARASEEDPTAEYALTDSAASPLNCRVLGRESAAIRRRVIRTWLSAQAGALSATHLERIDQLVVNYTGQGAVAIPWPQCPTMDGYASRDRLTVARRANHLVLERQPRPTPRSGH